MARKKSVAARSKDGVPARDGRFARCSGIKGMTGKICQSGLLKVSYWEHWAWGTGDYPAETR
jgi:hypothetical protein